MAPLASKIPALRPVGCTEGWKAIEQLLWQFKVVSNIHRTVRREDDTQQPPLKNDYVYGVASINMWHAKEDYVLHTQS